MSRAGPCVPAVLLGLWAGAVALSTRIEMSLALASPLLILPLLWWLLTGARNWLAGFLGAAILLPPLPIALGNSGPHPSLLFAVAGGWIGTIRLREWRINIDPVGQAMLVFSSVLLASVACAALYSGSGIAAGSLARVLLFAISVYTYLFSTVGPGAGNSRKTARIFRLLLAVAFLAAVFACIDFYYQLPAPAGYGAQFVWLDSGVFRRAQGLFYEASTLGNFCAFFLVMIAALGSEKRGARMASGPLLAIAGTVVASALVFSYSRASIAALGCALIALLFLRRGTSGLRRWIILVPFSFAAAGTLVFLVFPEFAQIYWLRMRASAEFFLEEPNRILSGRLESWKTIGNMLMEHPRYLLLGIGYKTLPYSDLAGGPVVADNMYLSLLVETGLPGLLAFLWLNVEIIRAGHRAACAGSLFGTWIFCFWIGEMVQMLSGDLFTYWRVLPLYFWVLAQAVREGGSGEHSVR